MRNLTLRQLVGFLGAMVAAVGVMIAGGSMLLSLEADRAEKSWSSYLAENSTRPRLQSSLRSAIGYGGLAHDFKNYILRKDSQRLPRLQLHLGAAKGIIAQYRALDLSEAESVALDDLERVLTEYAANGEKARDLVAEGLTAALIIPAITIDDTPAIRAMETLRRESMRHAGDGHPAADKASAQVMLREAIGYGGFIHSFKDYVLTRKAEHLNSARNDMERIRQAIVGFREQNLTRAEEVALQDVEATFMEYALMLDKAVALAGKGFSPEEIDRDVKVDDSLALRGLATLGRELSSQVDASGRSMQAILASMAAQGRAAAWLMAGVAVFLTVFVWWLLRHRVIGPVENLGRVMQSLAEGDTEIEIPHVRLPNEIGDMARTVVIFRQSTIERRESEIALGVANAELNAQIASLEDMRDRLEDQTGQALNLAEGLALAREEASRALVRAEADEERIRSVVSTISDAIITIDAHGIVQSFNPAAERIFGYREAEILGRNISMLVPEPHRSAHDGYVRDCAAGKPRRIINSTVEQVAQHRDGTMFPIDLSVSPMKIGGEMFFTGIIRDITDRKRAEEEIRRLALTDPLTGLANRNQFHRRIEDAIRLARRQEAMVALMMIDLDKFKPVNDTYGHPVGDALLKMVAETISRECRDIDTVARLGGDEFAVILVEPDGQEGVGHAATRLVKALSTPMNVLGSEVGIGASIGIAFFPTDGENEAELFRRADLALYEAKEAGRNCHRFFKADMEK